MGRVKSFLRNLERFSLYLEQSGLYIFMAGATCVVMTMRIDERNPYLEAEWLVINICIMAGCVLLAWTAKGFRVMRLVGMVCVAALLIGGQEPFPHYLDLLLFASILCWFAVMGLTFFEIPERPKKVKFTNIVPSEVPAPAPEQSPPVQELELIKPEPAAPPTVL